MGKRAVGAFLSQRINQAAMIFGWSIEDAASHSAASDLDSFRPVFMKRSLRRCSGKKQHSETNAGLEALRLKSYSSRYQSYLCGLCGFWHVGRRRLA